MISTAYHNLHNAKELNSWAVFASGLVEAGQLALEIKTVC